MRCAHALFLRTQYSACYISELSLDDPAPVRVMMRGFCHTAALLSCPGSRTGEGVLMPSLDILAGARTGEGVLVPSLDILAGGLQKIRMS